MYVSCIIRLVGWLRGFNLGLQLRSELLPTVDLDWTDCTELEECLQMTSRSLTSNELVGLNVAFQ